MPKELEATKPLRKLALNLDRRDWPNEVGYALYMQSRCLCNYVERGLRETPCNLCGSAKLVITGAKCRDLSFSVNSDGIACVRLPFDTARFTSLGEDQGRHRLFMSMIENGISAIAPAPGAKARGVLHGLLARFAAEGFRNSWRHQLRRFPRFGLTARLDCALTPASFVLWLTVSRRDGAEVSRKILRTDPDELAYDYRFKDIMSNGKTLTVTSKRSLPLVTLRLAELFSDPPPARRARSS
ncbi:MAG: hypothetical protein HYY18_14280 [Planctomycetes bacterium]|nr:hypothetical protein [Planctomycetota bacterium]